MPWSGSGTYTLVYDWVNDKNSAINPQAVRFKGQDDDMATALNNCLTRDAQGKPSTDFSFNSFRGLALANGTTRTDAINAAQYQDGTLALAGSVAGTDTITASLSPAITVYANGMVVRFIPANTNTGAATLNLNGVAARSIVKSTGVALVAGDLVAGIPAAVVYDLANTRWVLLNNLKVPDAALSSNVPLLNAANSFTANLTLSGADKRLRFVDGAAPAGMREWFMMNNNGVFQLWSATDATSAFELAFQVSKNAASEVTAFAVIADSITLNGVAATDFARLSQTNAFTGPTQTINGSASNTLWVANANAGTLRGVLMQTGALTRWVAVTTTDAEGGANSGSNYIIGRYSDAGGFIDSPISIARSTGIVTLNGVAQTDFARLSQANTFTNATQTIAATGVSGAAWVCSADSSTAFFGVSDTTSQYITGDNAGMAIMRGNSGVGFSGNGGTTMHLKLDSSGALTTPNAAANEVGYKGAPINSVSGGYTLVLADAGKTVKSTSGNITIPDDSGVTFPDGTIIHLHNRTGGNITVTKTTAAGLKWNGFDGSTGARTLANNSSATIYKSQGDEWLISGAGLS